MKYTLFLTSIQIFKFIQSFQARLNSIFNLASLNFISNLFTKATSRFRFKALLTYRALYLEYDQDSLLQTLPSQKFDSLPFLVLFRPICREKRSVSDA